MHDETKDSANEAKVFVAEMIKNRQPYKCDLLKPAKAKLKHEWLHTHTLLIFQNSL